MSRPVTAPTTDAAFLPTVKVDKYGRKANATKKEDLERFYHLEDEDEEDEEGDEEDDEEQDDREEVCHSTPREGRSRGAWIMSAVLTRRLTQVTHRRFIVHFATSAFVLTSHHR